MASIAFLPQDFQELPGLLEGAAGDELNTIAVSTNPIYIYELFATAVTIFRREKS